MRRSDEQAAVAGAEAVRDAVRLVAASTAALVAEDGRYPGTCESRVLESAAALRLLQLLVPSDPAVARARGFLCEAGKKERASELDRMVVAAALGTGVPAGPELTDRLLTGFTHFTAVRKRLLLETLLYLTGAVDRVAEPVWEAFEARHLQVWKQIEMTACKAVLAAALGRPERVTAEDLALLAGTVRAGEVFEGNLLDHVLLLHALARHPGHDGPVRTGLATLIARQRPDGGFPLVADMDPVLTGLAGTALAESGADPAAQARLGDWLAARQHPSGAWNYTAETSQTDIETTSFVLEALASIDPARHRGALRSGCAYLAGMQNTDGGLPLYARGNPSEAATTGEAVTAWARTDADRYAARIEDAVRFLIDGQCPDGTWGLEWSASEGNVILRAVYALLRATDAGVLPDGLAHRAGKAVDMAVTRLLTSQNSDGGWGFRPTRHSDAISTAYALTTLSLAGRHQAAPAGAAFLCSRVDTAGRVDAEYDTYSPRPLMIEITSLPRVYVLRGLVHAARSLAALLP
ncbi:prenyltransferase/squalene oxidase repeat-containing protein [Streptomyces clavuligerus]|uniref:Prenyltransferase/squalene oxidase n=1 Tax=Streptomyces clavuligerus TaxID=1901 RepID=B5GLQ0_STRCL|nr:prenyltransferase/squalene oxidase repeat-containing protein [Streptomyces clavuligerus]EDY47246.1 hypothetical protein SSCG_00274 [Streptomyces clavuligerus]EFG04910.1 prenyltransferase/squalene oxidase [Streptomyces clavuligerus]MBY6306651.1 terpene cyclase/mutase family protein [Streptomyces clavuligerus]QCS10742.1 hypothetical protein CRV15_35060 [Streptomyces clavuligerus]QPJ97222.1 hypothetical protein GE265_29420 [Streptomyces clavuligerus]